MKFDKDNTEKLLHTNLMELLGGKGMPTHDLWKEETNIPPQPPTILNNGGDNGNNHHMPELRSSEVNEVLNQPPAWLVRWGITVFFFVLTILLAVSWFVQYPDLVSSTLIVVSTNMPKSVIAKSDGRLIQLMVKDGQIVEKAQVVGYLESTAKHEEVLTLEKTVNQLIELSINQEFNRIHQVRIPLFFSLGELQKSYQAFQEAYIRSQSSTINGSYLKKKGAVGRDISTLQSLHENTRQQLTLQEKDLQMALEEAQTQQRLSEKGLVSKQEARNAQSRYLSKKQAFEQAHTALDNNLMNQNQKQQELIEIDKTITEQKNNLVQALNSLKSDIEAWKQRYIAIAPIDGKVNFLTNLQENQVIKSGQELLYVLPDNAAYYGEMLVGQYNFGKIKRGQEVIVKLQSYPFQEFGTIEGRIDHISDMPKDTAYLIKVIFPKGLITNANKKLPFRNGMTASGEIVTENLRLIEKFFYDIRKSMKR